jgi:hypothetical protein
LASDLVQLAAQSPQLLRAPSIWRLVLASKISLKVWPSHFLLQALAIHALRHSFTVTYCFVSKTLILILGQLSGTVEPIAALLGAAAVIASKFSIADYS